MKTPIYLLTLFCVFFAIQADDQFGVDLTRRYGVNSHIMSTNVHYLKPPKKHKTNHPRCKRRRRGQHPSHPSTMRTRAQRKVNNNIVTPHEDVLL